jgi:hypothetical protein
VPLLLRGTSAPADAKAIAQRVLEAILIFVIAAAGVVLRW